MSDYKPVRGSVVIDGIPLVALSCRFTLVPFGAIPSPKVCAKIAPSDAELHNKAEKWSNAFVINFWNLRHAESGIGTTTIDCASSGERDNMQARIDAKLEAKAAAGPTAREGVGAGMSDAIPTLPLH